MDYLTKKELIDFIEELEKSIKAKELTKETSIKKEDDLEEIIL